VKLHEDTVVPRVLLALDGIGFVVEAKIAEDLGTVGIGGYDLRFAVHEAIRLIKIRGRRYIGGNDLIVLERLGDAIDLNGEQHRNAVSSQFARQRDRFGSSPAVSVEDDAGILLFLGR
jgi:hypothetical protein